MAKRKSTKRETCNVAYSM